MYHARYTTARHFNIERKNVRSWVDPEEKLTKMRGEGRNDAYLKGNHYLVS